MDELRHIQDWLQSQNTTLWGRSFNVTDDAESAARWFQDQLNSYCDFAKQEDPQ